MEIWKPIPGFETHYAVSNFGRVKRTLAARGATSNRILKGGNSHGYHSMVLCKNDIKSTFMVHQLVLLAFFGESDLNINHKNGIKNDNRLENLEYATQKYNRHHSLYILNERRHINASIALEIRNARAQGEKRASIRQRLGLPKYIIDDVLCGRTWKHA